MFTEYRTNAKMLIFKTKYNPCNTEHNLLFYSHGRIEITALKVKEMQKVCLCKLSLCKLG